MSSRAAKNGAETPRSRSRRRELTALAALPDALIDVSDIPEVEDWSDAVVGKYFRPRKQAVTLRLDADLLAWLRAVGPGYQTRVNRLLRAVMNGQRARDAKRRGGGIVEPRRPQKG